MSYTSIKHYGRWNCQIDYPSTLVKAVDDFERYCVLSNAVWGHLFEDKTGIMVATFNNVNGLIVSGNDAHVSVISDERHSQ